MILYALCTMLAIAVGLLWVVYTALVSRVERLEQQMAAAEGRGDRHRAEIDALKAEVVQREARASQRARESGALQ